VDEITPEIEREVFRRAGRRGGLKSWANTVDRKARVAPGIAQGPARLAWHAKKLGLDPDNLTPDETKRAEAAQKLYYLDLAERGRKACAAKRAAKAASDAT
jgi:hypothetical protein